MFAEQAFPNSAPPEPGMLRDLRATATKVRDADGRRGLSVLAHAVSRRALGSPTTPDLLKTRAIVPLSVAFPLQAHGRHPDCVFRSSIPGPSMPLSTLHPAPRGTRRKTRGQDGSLLLSCGALSSPTARRFIPTIALAHARGFVLGVFTQTLTRAAGKGVVTLKRAVDNNT